MNWKDVTIPYQDDNGKLSNCCTAPIKWQDVCTACGEHCEAIEEENQ